MRYQARSASELLTLCPVSVGSDAELIRARILTGECDFFTLDDTAFVVKGEVTTRGREFVICCAEGKGLRRTIRAIHEHAKRQRFDFVRYHPKTPSAGRALAKMAGVAFETAPDGNETVYLVRLHDGQQVRQ